MQKRDDEIASARKVLQIIDIMSTRNGELSVTQLAGLLDCSVSSTNRFLSTMRAAGYVDKNAVTNRYFLTNRVFAICNSMLYNNRTLQSLIAMAHMLSRRYDVSVNINTMYGNTPIMLYRDTTLYNKDLDFLIGETAPAFCSSSGKAMLSLYSREALDAFFKELEITPYQHKTLTKESLRKDIEQAAKRGFAVCLEEFVSGVFSMSFPFRDRIGDLYTLTFITTMSDRKRVYNPEVIEDVRTRIESLSGK